MPDPFKGMESLISQGRKAALCVPGPGILVDIPKALWINAAGTLTGIAVDDLVAQSYTVAPGVFDAVQFRIISAAPANTIMVV